MTLKKVLSFFLAMLMLFSVTVCGKKDSAQEDEQGGGTKDSLAARINLQFSSIEVVDDCAVKMTLFEPSVDFPGNLANIPIVDKKTCADGTFDLTKNANGTDPYKFIKFDEANQTISMEAYESYWGKRPLSKTCCSRRLLTLLPPLWRFSPGMLTTA